MIISEQYDIQKVSATSVMILKILKYRHIENFPEISPILKIIADIKKYTDIKYISLFLVLNFLKISCHYSVISTKLWCHLREELKKQFQNHDVALLMFPLLDLCACFFMCVCVVLTTGCLVGTN